MILSNRGWLRLQVPEEWDTIGSGIWTTPHGGHVSVADILHSQSDISPEIAVEAHESWCEAHHLNAQQIRMEQLPNGVCVLRSFGETRSDEFMMVAHFWHSGYLTLLVFRSAMERLADEDIADVLNAILEAAPPGKDLP